MDILFAIKEIKDDKLVNEKVWENVFSFYLLINFFILESKNCFRYRSNLFEIRSYSTK
jgi:hypothetical protein